MQTESYDTGLVMCCHIAGVFDVNRKSILPANDFSALEPWVRSVVDKGLKAIIFHNHFTANTCAKHAHPLLQFKRVAFNNTYNPNVFRYFAYRHYLQQHGHNIAALFLTDATDVVMQLNPFADSFFKTQPGKLFCGDEPKPLDNDWMRNHGKHMREQNDRYVLFEATFKEQPLLNCGVIGGRKQLVYEFLESLCAFHRQYNQHNPTEFTGDMGAFNFIARTQFNKLIVHGKPVNTVFKNYEIHRRDCWFQHK